MQYVNNVDFSVLKQEMTKCCLLVSVSCSKGYSWAALCMFPCNLSCSMWLKWLWHRSELGSPVCSCLHIQILVKDKVRNASLEISGLLALTLGTLSVSIAASQLPVFPVMWPVSSVSRWRFKLFLPLCKSGKERVFSWCWFSVELCVGYAQSC